MGKQIGKIEWDRELQPKLTVISENYLFVFLSFGESGK